MTYAQLPQPHSPEDGSLEPEDVADDAKPNYDVEETNVKGGDYDAAHAAPVQNADELVAEPIVENDKDGVVADEKSDDKEDKA